MISEERYADVASRIEDLARDRPRTVIAVAGPPASGKSTLAEALTATLNARGISAKVVPMDGFHLDNSILEERGLLARKGAPETFDAEGFIALVRRLKQGGNVSIPLFDRRRDTSVQDADMVPGDCAVIVVEGNYLLFDEHPWRELAGLWDLSVGLHVPVEELRRRLVQRWLDHGLSEADAVARTESNDLPNEKRVRGASLPADVYVRNVD
jgi:fructokinase